MTNLSVVLNSPTGELLKSQLFPKDGCEAGAILLFGISDIAGSSNQSERRYLSHFVCQIPPDDIESASPQHFSWRKRTFLQLLKRAQTEHLAIGFIHSHRSISAFFSDQDDLNDRDVAELVANRTSGTVEYLSLVADEDRRVVARIVPRHGQPVHFSRCAVLGQPWDWQTNASIPIDTRFYDRQVLAFGPDFLAVLKRIRICIVGAGATGSATTVLLARNGASDLVLIDPDHVDHSNLSRLHGATFEDAELSRLKVATLARHIEGFGMGSRIVGYSTHAADPSIRDVLKSCDLIFGCTDDHAGRLFLNRFSYFYNTPLIDMGIAIDPARLHEGVIASADARVTVVGPGLPCLVCRRIVDVVRARDEQLAHDRPEEFHRQLAEGYVARHDIRNPAVIALTTSVACMAVDELSARTSGYRMTSDNHVRKHRIKKDVFPGDKIQESCGVCGNPGIWGRGDVEPFLDRIG